MENTNRPHRNLSNFSSKQKIQHTDNSQEINPSILMMKITSTKTNNSTKLFQGKIALKLTNQIIIINQTILKHDKHNNTFLKDKIFAQPSKKYAIRKP